MICFFWSWFFPKPWRSLASRQSIDLIPTYKHTWNLYKKKKTSQAWYPKRAKYLSLETSLHAQVFLNISRWKFFSECAVIIIQTIFLFYLLYSVDHRFWSRTNRASLCWWANCFLGWSLLLELCSFMRILRSFRRVHRFLNKTPSQNSFLKCLWACLGTMRKAHPPELKKNMDKKLSLRLNGVRHVQGVLRGLDPFVNLVVDEYVEMATECLVGNRTTLEW